MLRAFMCGIAAAGFIASSMGPVVAQETPAGAEACVCLAPSPEGDGPVGSVAFASGQVLASQGAELLTAGPGTLLLPGSQVITGAGSSANLSVGTCVVTMGADSEVFVSQIEAGICVQMKQAAVSTEPPPSSTLMTKVLPLTIVGGGVAAALALGGGDDGGAGGASN